MIEKILIKKIGINTEPTESVIQNIRIKITNEITFVIKMKCDNFLLLEYDFKDFVKEMTQQSEINYGDLFRKICSYLQKELNCYWVDMCVELPQQTLEFKTTRLSEGSQGSITQLND